MSYSVHVFLYINKVFVFKFFFLKVISAWNPSNQKFLREKKNKLEIQSKEYTIREKAKRKEKK